MARQNKWDSKHQKDLERYARQIDAIYQSAVREAAAIGTTISNFSPDKPFSFADYPNTRNRIDKLLNGLKSGLNTVILNGVDSEWTLANNKNNELCNVVFGNNVKNLSTEQQRRYYRSNGKACDAFKARKTAGLGLSDRVWNYTNQFKSEIEMGLDLGLRDGLSAAEMSRELRSNLKYPDKLFRRVRDEHGQLHLSKAAKAFNPGQGVYRSSYKNAMRLTRTETNMAYRTSDYTRWQQLDFVVGIEVHLSGNHPEADICDSLAGKYPKDFKFTGWHPQCRCHTTSILKTEEEMQADNERIMNGEPLTGDSKNRVDDVPQQFKDWTADNEKRLTTAKSMPYFVRDNEKYFPEMRITNAAAKGVKEAQAFNDVLEVKSRANVFGDAEVEISEKVLYRGDIRDKGDKFSDNAVDYMMDGEAKNKAGFHFFTDSKGYATDYATKQMNQMRGKIQTNILTTVKTDKGLYILDLDKMTLKEQMEFHRSLFDYGIKNVQYKQELISQYKGDYSLKSIDKFFGYSTYGKILNSGQSYSDGGVGVLFKKWLKGNGFDGYAFTMFKDKEYALINSDRFSVIERTNLIKSINEKAAIRHAARTPEEAATIANTWHQR